MRVKHPNSEHLTWAVPGFFGGDLGQMEADAQSFMDILDTGKLGKNWERLGKLGKNWERLGKIGKDWENRE